MGIEIVPLGDQAIRVSFGPKTVAGSAGIGGHQGRAHETRDVLYGNSDIVRNRFLHPDWVPKYGKDLTVRVVPGPHADKFTADAIRTLLKEGYTVTPQSNRMGYQLNGPKLEHLGRADIISDPIPFGGIQVPANGQPIILMA